MGTITKRPYSHEDGTLWDGAATLTYTALTSTNRTMTVHKLGAKDDFAWQSRFGDVYLRGPIVDVRAWHGSGSAATTNANMTNGQYTLTLDSASNFRNKQGVRVARADAGGADLVTTINSGETTTTLTLADACGNTVTNATVWHDDTTQIQNALNNAASNNCKEVYMPPGIYRVGQINVPSNIVLRGAGRNYYVSSNFDGRGTTLRGRTAATTIVNVFGGAASRSDQREHVVLQDFSIDGMDLSGVVGLRFWNFRYCNMDRLHIQQCQKGLWVGRTGAGDTCYHLHMNDSLIDGCARAVTDASSGARPFIYAQNMGIRNATYAVDGGYQGTWIGGFIGAAASYGFRLNGGQNFTVLNCNMENTGKGSGKDYEIREYQNLNILGGGTTTSGGTRGRTHSVHVYDCDGGMIQGLQIAEGGGDDANFIGIRLEASARAMTVWGSRFEGFSGAQVEMSAATTSDCFIWDESYEFLVRGWSWDFRCASSKQLLRFYVGAGGYPRYYVTSEGHMYWGPGGASLTDTQLRRSGNNFLSGTTGTSLNMARYRFGNTSATPSNIQNGDVVFTTGAGGFQPNGAAATGLFLRVSNTWRKL